MVKGTFFNNLNDSIRSGERGKKEEEDLMKKFGSYSSISRGMMMEILRQDPGLEAGIMDRIEGHIQGMAIDSAILDHYEIDGAFVTESSAFPIASALHAIKRKIPERHIPPMFRIDPHFIRQEHQFFEDFSDWNAQISKTEEYKALRRKISQLQAVTGKGTTEQPMRVCILDEGFMRCPDMKYLTGQSDTIRDFGTATVLMKMMDLVAQEEHLSILLFLAEGHSTFRYSEKKLWMEFPIVRHALDNTPGTTGVMPRHPPHSPHAQKIEAYRKYVDALGDYASAMKDKFMALGDAFLAKDFDVEAVDGELRLNAPFSYTLDQPIFHLGYASLPFAAKGEVH